DGRTYELMAVRGGRPVYRITHNANAAISTATDLAREETSPTLSGQGLIVGVWDAGWIRATHQEFGGRVTVKDLGGELDYHSTHVGGTVGAAGIAPAAKGMAPAVKLYSYEWTTDTGEMTGAGANGPNQSGFRLLVSNHSYGNVTGWMNGDWSGKYGLHWFGVWGEREDRGFGLYTEEAADWDTIVYTNPYLLPFLAAGNDRGDPSASEGRTYYYLIDPEDPENAASWRSASYDPATGPLPDNHKEGGFDTISTFACAKNLMLVGAVNDAVADGERDLTRATMANFSVWGPTDDGRIKPDVVANGVGLTSTSDAGDEEYLFLSGTSMAAPNAAGSAVLLIELFERLFPGQDMLASTLKALIIHTADDLGNPGPDYRFGWGLMNTKAAADHIQEHHDLPFVSKIIEGVLTKSNSTDTYSFFWDDTGPIRATLCWTDPPGEPLDGLNITSPRLVNDLDLRITGPDGLETRLPYVLDPENPQAPATNGDNIVDNVEQIEIPAPETIGAYAIRVSHKGELSGDRQFYSLILSGQRPDVLKILPVDAFHVGGPAGGPFLPIYNSWSLTNTSDREIEWRAWGNAGWIDLPTTLGILPPGESASVAVLVGDVPETFVPGAYVASVTFENIINHVQQVRRLELEVRPVASYRWGLISSPQVANEPIAATLTAVDSEGETVTVLTFPVDIAGWMGPGTLDVGSPPTGTRSYPMYTEWEDARTQVIYLAGEIGATGDVAEIALNVVERPGQTLNNWTIRMKHTSLSGFGDSHAWENEGWTVVYTANEKVFSLGWVGFPLTTPFPYNGIDNLTIDFTYDNTFWTSNGQCRSYDTPENRAVYSIVDSKSGDPLTWSGTVPTPYVTAEAPNIRLTMGSGVDVFPGGSGFFEHGVWSGAITPRTEARGMYLVARDPQGNEGRSNLFDVLPGNVATPTPPPTPTDARTLIEHFYWYVLGRGPEPGAVEAWESGYFNYALAFDIDVRFLPQEMGRLFFLSDEYALRKRSDAAFITDCYTAFLQRPPSPSDLAAWLSGSWNRPQVVAVFAESQEFTDLVRRLFPDQTGDPTRNFVTAMYIGLLDRLVDTGGLAHWTGIFNAAPDPVEQSKAMARDIVASPEFLSAEPTNRDCVVRLYRAFLGRFPGSSEQVFWIAELAVGRQTVDGLIEALGDSPEFGARLAAYF
ncbi:MAG TPA: S8 family serine peptidase, partial [Sumerlaeia bacterium]|nr:S8 family serine peptidase [Sumerlaeia bacterium]